MSGRPKRERLIAYLAALAVTEFGEGAQPLDVVLDRLRSGATFTEFAESISGAIGEPCSRAFLSQTAHELSPAAKDLIETARMDGADGFAESTVLIADRSAETSGGAAKARNQISARQWWAARLAPERFGDKLSASLTLNVAQLMLQALEAPPPTRPLPATAKLLEGPAEVVEA